MRNLFLCFLLLFLFFNLNKSKAQNGLIEAKKLNRIAEDYMASLNYSEAALNLKKAISIAPNLRSTYIKYNFVCTKLHLYQQQKLMLQQAQKYFSNDDEFYYHLGNNYHTQGNLDLAIQEYNLAVKYGLTNDPNYPLMYAYYLHRGVCYFKKKLYLKALDDFNSALILDRFNKVSYLNRGIVYLKIGERDKACIDWNKAYEKGSDKAQEYLELYCPF